MATLGSRIEKIRRNKKASALDLIFIGTAVLFFGLVVLLGFKVLSEINTIVQANTDIPTEAHTSTAQLRGYYPGIVDNSFLFFVAGLSMVALILAALVRVHPIFIPLFIIALIFIVFISGILSNIYQEMAADSNLTAEADELTFISNILTYLPFIIAIIGTLMMAIMYKLFQTTM